jgi:hypothetical protein
LSANFSGRPLLWQLRVRSNRFRYFNSSPEVIRLVVMMYVRYPLSLRNVEDLLAERSIDINVPIDDSARYAILARLKTRPVCHSIHTGRSRVTFSQTQRLPRRRYGRST